MVKEYMMALKLVGALVLFCVVIATGLALLAPDQPDESGRDAGDIESGPLEDSVCTAESAEEICLPSKEDQE
jgi:hypothetical protein